MAQFSIYIDVVNNLVIGGIGIGQGQAASLPPFVEGDTPSYQIFLCTPTNNPLTPYTLMPIGGLSLQVAIGDKIGNVTNYYTTQFVWAPSTDPTQPNYFFATLPLNTAAITTLIGGASSAQSTFEVKYLQNGVPTTVLSQQITIQATVIKNGGVVVPPGLTALSAEVANATFLKNPVSDLFLLGGDGHIYTVYVDGNGSLQCSRFS